MPIYEYHCEKCGKNFDVEQRMVDDALTVHDECGGAVVKVFSSAGIVLKGAGFYKTDTRSPSGSKSAAKTTADKPEKKTESAAPAQEKPAAPKTDAKPSPPQSS